MTSFAPEEPSPVAVEQLRRDVAEAERRLSQAQEELEIITSLLNHDMRSPLVSIMGFVAELGYLRDESFAMWGAADSANPKHAELAVEFDEAFRYLDGGARRLGHLLDVLSALARHRRRVLTLEMVDLASLIPVTAGSIPELSADALHIEGVLPTLRSDREALSEIFRRLFENAVRYRSAAAPTVTLSHTSDARRVSVLVTDNGRGIAEADRARVFRPFVRLAPLVESGDGVGLTHARSLARRLGGELSVEAGTGGGSTFHLELPRKVPAPMPAFRA